MNHEEELFVTIKKLEKLPPNFPFPEPAPKYDPCRRFKCGDKVRETLVKGRRYDAGYPEHLLGEIATVEKGEDSYNLVRIRFQDGTKHTYDAAYLELVTPVEELEPYFVEHNANAYKLRKGGQELAIYWDTHPNAKEAAEEERDRLNAEWRQFHNASFMWSGCELNGKEQL